MPWIKYITVALWRDTTPRSILYVFKKPVRCPRHHRSDHCDLSTIHLEVPRLFSNAMDIYTILIVAVIMLSGIFLEASQKMVAYSDYKRMVDEYSG